MTKPDSNQPFQLQERGNRTSPGRSARTYWSLKLLLQKLQRTLDSDLLLPGENVIDYVCADKPYQSLFVEKFPKYVGADLPGNPQADLNIGPAGELPCAEGSFDCVLSSQVLEHVVDPHQYLKEAFRVLRDGGSLVLSVAHRLHRAAAAGQTLQRCFNLRGSSQKEGRPRYKVISAPCDSQ